MWTAFSKDLLEEFRLVPNYSERLVRLKSRLEAFSCTNKRHLAPPRAESASKSARKSKEVHKEEPQNLREMVVYEDM